MWLATDRDERGATSHMRRTGIGVRLCVSSLLRRNHSTLQRGMLQQKKMFLHQKTFNNDLVHSGGNRQPPPATCQVHQLERTLQHILSRNRVDLQVKSSF